MAVPSFPVKRFVRMRTLSIGTGVGGAVADVIGRKIHEVAKHSQVLCITHLAPVAASATNHFVVVYQHNPDQQGTSRPQSQAKFFYKAVQVFARLTIRQSEPNPDALRMFRTGIKCLGPLRPNRSSR